MVISHAVVLLVAAGSVWLVTAAPIDLPQASQFADGRPGIAPWLLRAVVGIDLVLLAAQRAREISGGAELTIDRDRDKNPVVALREIADETVRPTQLHETLVGSLQRVLPDDDDEADEIGSLSQSAEALRITAAAPVRNTSIGGDYEG